MFCQKTSLRPFFTCSLLVLCFLGIFFMYKFDIKYPNFDNFMEQSRQFCPTFLCAERAQTQDSNKTTHTELHTKPPYPNDTQTTKAAPQPSNTQTTKAAPQPSNTQTTKAAPHPSNTQTTKAAPEPSNTQTTKAAAVEAEPDTIVLIWMWPFGFRYDVSCSIFNVAGCHLTDDRTLYHKAHGVLFHHRNIDLGDMPKEPRPFFQKWVWFNMESPANTHQHPSLNEVFNLTCSYRLDSNIPVPYGRLEPVTPEDESFKLPEKNKLLCWIVSNWSPQSNRVKFFDELKKHIEIHTYGGAFGKRPSEQEYMKIVSSCKFYLSFENSIYKDYITEKLYRPMAMGTVPIVLGPPRKQYEDHIPPDSFIHVDDFSTPKELAERLLYLDQNNSEYMRYFDWRSRFKSVDGLFGREHACRTCIYLKNHKEYHAVHDLNKWFWG